MLKGKTKVEKLKKTVRVKKTEEVPDVKAFLIHIHDPEVLGKTMKGLSE